MAIGWTLWHFGFHRLRVSLRTQTTRACVVPRSRRMLGLASQPTNWFFKKLKLGVEFMSHKRKGQLTVSGEWARHLRPYLRRAFWKQERQAEKAHIKSESAEIPTAKPPVGSVVADAQRPCA